nr:MAG TPA: hypothetical protein [Caudoviricetes sp.]
MYNRKLLKTELSSLVQQDSITSKKKFHKSSCFNVFIRL